MIIIAPLALILGAAPARPQPRAVASAESVVFVPQLRNLKAALPFFEQAGRRSALLRPSSWRELASPLLQVDVTSEESLQAAGIDPGGPLSLSHRDGYDFSCVVVSEGKRHGRVVEERLARFGEVFHTQVAGLDIAAARDSLGRVLAASATRGPQSCAVHGHGLSVERVMAELPALLGKTASGPVFKGVSDLGGLAFLIWPTGDPSGVMALEAGREWLRVDAKASLASPQALAGAGASPFAALRPPGLLALRVRLTAPAAGVAVEQFLRAFPVPPELVTSGATLRPLLTGPVAVYVHSVRVTHGLHTRAARLMALKFVVLAECSDAAKAQEVVAGVDPKALKTPQGAYEVGVRNRVVFLTNDPAARDAVLSGLSSAQGTQGHSVVFHVDPPKVAEGLAQVPLLDAIKAPELAGMLAVSTELGPLLLASAEVAGWVELARSPGSVRAQLTWTLAGSGKVKPLETDGGQ